MKSPSDFGSLNGTVIAVGKVFAPSTDREATMRATLSLIILFLEALATFYGRIESSAIEGTFVSVCDNGVLTRQGRWRVTRQRR